MQGDGAASRPLKEESVYLVSVSTYDEVRKIVDSRDLYWISDCRCRLDRGGVCTKSMRVCLGFGPKCTSSESHLAPADKKEVLELLELARTERLVPRPHVGDDGAIAAVCFCCACCCCYHQSASDKARDKAGPGVSSLDRDACLACGQCVEVCHFGALILEDGTPELKQARCHGCGLCAEECPSGAIRMELRAGAPGR